MKRNAVIIMISTILIGGLIFYYSPLLALASPEAGLLTAAGACLILLGLSLYLLKQDSRQQEKIQQLDNKKHQADNQLKEYEQRFETMLDHSSTGIAILSLEGNFMRVNQSLCNLLSYDVEEMQTLNFYQLIHANDLNNLQMHIQEMLDKKTSLYKSEQLCYTKGGETIWVMSTISIIRDSNGNPDYFIVQAQNITLQKKAEERLRHMAYHDPLTGLANRNKLEQFINHILVSARRHQQQFALLFLDLDRFKNINDTIGHEAGDSLLQIIGDRLRSTVRNTDLVARLGGDEFMLVITDVKKTEGVALIAQKILESVLQTIVVKGQELYITTSIGISLYPYDGQNLQSLMKNADLALYRAKEQGRNDYQFFTAEMTTRAQQKMSLQNALGHALAKDEFSLHYQPKMDLQTRFITGVEALLRWKNKDYVTVTPDEIVGLAEETGLIIPVSEWVLKTACRQLKQWNTMGLTSLTMAVNCSSRQFKQARFVDDVLDVISLVGIPASSLEIEVTESIIMDDPENTLRILYALKDLGVQIVIDDFGTGYWSLSNLRRLSVDKIKIDKTFIKQLTIDDTSASITTAIIAMVNKLGIKSIAEGVETREQYDFLVREGCTEIQGYYLTRPLSDVAMTSFLKHPIPDAEAISQSETTV